MQVVAPDYVIGPTSQSFTEMVTTTHATYLLNFAAFDDGGYLEKDGSLARATAGNRLLGYTIALVEVVVTANDNGGGGLVLASLSNVGVAPFYYPLELSLVVANSTTNQPASCSPGTLVFSGLDLRRLQAGQTAQLRANLPEHALGPGCEREFSLALRSSHAPRGG